MGVYVFGSEMYPLCSNAAGKTYSFVLDVGDYKGRRSVKARSIDVIDRNPEEFIPQAEIADDIPAAIAFMKEIHGRLRSEEARQLWERFTTDNWVRRLGAAAAAKEVHHAYRGGFLEHVCSLLKAYAAWHDAGIYPHINGDVVFLGLLLHDIGKVIELAETNPGIFDYTQKGVMQGHIVLGYRMCYEAAKELGIEGSALVEQVLHVILAHHGSKEFGSPVLPATEEAFMVHFLDTIDAKLTIAKATPDGQRALFLGNTRIFRFEAEEAVSDDEPLPDEA